MVLDEELHFSSWRIFLVVCSLPSFAAVIGLYHMPESPRFLLEKGREVEAMMVYKVRNFDLKCGNSIFHDVRVATKRKGRRESW